MAEYGFSLIRIFSYEDRIFGFVFIWENTGPLFWHILASVWGYIASILALVHLFGAAQK